MTILVNEHLPLMEIAEARKYLADAVATQPEGFRYVKSADLIGKEGEMNCFYLPQPDRFPAEDPRSYTGCIIGTAMRLAGRTVLSEHESNPVDDLTETFRLSGLATKYFVLAQDNQDEGGTWAEALRAAEGWYTNQQFIDGHTDQP